MKNAIINNEVEFPEEAFGKISDEAKDFIKACLVKNYKDRPEVPELLNHVWIQNADKEENIKRDV